MHDRYDKAKHNKWAKELKKWFEKSSIRWCEKCGTTTPPLDIAHSRHRYDIKTRDQYFEAALICRACHKAIDSQKHEPTMEAIQALIASRPVAA